MSIVLKRERVQSSFKVFLCLQHAATTTKKLNYETKNIFPVFLFLEGL